LQSRRPRGRAAGGLHHRKHRKAGVVGSSVGDSRKANGGKILPCVVRSV
jgi:hypothetical protein